MHILPALTAAALFSVATAQAAAPAKASPAEQAAIYKAAGFVKKAGAWRSACGLDDPSASYMPGSIDEYRDINGDGRPDAIVNEGGTFCYGNTGNGYWLLSKQASGAWKVLDRNQGVPEFLKTKGAGGWPDISVGGPGFCFPVLRWNGTSFVRNRMEYQGRRCRG